MIVIFILEKLFSDSTHKSTVFNPAQIEAVEAAAYTKILRGKETPFIKCLVRGKEIRLTPEEAVRQMFIRKLIDDYGYSTAQMAVEHPIHFGREVKRADIVIFESNRPNVEYIIVEVKKPKLKDGKLQLKSYCNATGATMGVWSNGEKISFYHRKDPNYFEDIPDIPRAGQKLKDILRERRTIENLIAEDKLLRENKTLADLIRELEDEVLANAGVDVFEEVFKLIYTKLFDEMLGGRDKNRVLEFWNYGETDSELKDTIQNLFDRAKEKWAGIFADDDKIKLTPSHLAICVSSLQNVKLFNSNLDVIDDAFEYLMSKSQKGEKGQFFTPRYVIDMCVKMLNPNVSETMIDTAAGSCGFPVHTTFFVWKKILADKGIAQSHLFTLERKPPECEDYVGKNIFAIDFDEKTVRVARTLNLIAGDGKTNVLHLNTLDYERWEEIIDEDWLDIYNDGWKGLRKLRAVKNDNSKFNFDIVMANPPFAGDIKESRIIAKYELGKNSKGKYQSKVGRDILFIERNLNFLRPGGRMAIILPQGRFNNSSDKYIRDFIAERCRILAVVGLHGNVFKPHTGTKTSVLFVQKWDDKLCPRRDDYPIFFATMREPSKDNSGEKILETVGGKFLRDSNHHTIVRHDLFNHDGLTRDGIAEAFIEFAKREGLSFFECGSFEEEKYRRLSEELECTEKFLSTCAAATDYFRLEAEYFNSQSFSYARLLRGKDIVDEIQYGTSNFCDENSVGGCPVLRLNELRNGFIGVPQKFCHTLMKAEFEALRLHKGDVLIIRTNGNPNLVGRAAVVMRDTNFAFASYLFRVIPNDLIHPEVLMSFLNCRYGRIEIDKNSMKGNQTNFSPAKFRDINLPAFGKIFQAQIKSIVQSAFSLSERADEKYRAAEKILSEALGLEKFLPSEENVAIKNFGASFKVSGRLDAEFYQPKYEDWKNFMTAAGTVGELCKVHDKNFSPKPKTIYKYIELANVATNGNISTPEKICGEELPTRARRIVKAGQVIISSIEGSLQNCALITEENDGALCSTGFFVVDSKIFNSETLLVLFKSELMQNLMRQQCTGTILTAMSPENFLNLPLPIIEREVQEKIAAQVAESFRVRGESEKFLTRAKDAVELAIEQGEDVAIKILSDTIR
ncbi:MAG: N-6 DNA methylase [Selenomonadaceae bacterium]|nr:N-6 DNA methylase [Selenomonadaceae bacterium]